MSRDRRDAERERLERIESKIAPIIAGAVAALGFFIDKASSAADLCVSALLLIPIAMLLLAFRTTDYQDFPNVDTLVQTFQWYPKTYYRSLVQGAALTIATNAPIIDRKARDLNRAMIVLFITIVFIFAFRVSEAVIHERPQRANSDTGSHAATPPTPAATQVEVKKSGPEKQ